MTIGSTVKKATIRVCRRIKGWGRGCAFTAKDFADIANRGSIDVALSLLAKTGTIRRIMRGIYDYPKYSKLLNKHLTPDYHEITKAYARSIGAKIRKPGAVAANLLGLTEQVPAKLIYISSCRSKVLNIAGRKVFLKNAAPRNFLGDEKTRMVISALQFLGKDGVSADTIKRLKTLLSARERKRLLKMAKYEKSWIASAALSVLEETSHG